MYSDYKVRKYGNEWHYCNADCNNCSLRNYTTDNKTTATTDTYTSNKLTLENGGNNNV